MDKPGLVSFYALVFSIFIAIFVVFVKNLMEKAEETKSKILSKPTPKDGWQECYDSVVHFSLITVKYFHLLGIFLVLQVLKVMLDLRVATTILNIIYFVYLCWYIPRIWKTEYVSARHPRILLVMYFIIPSAGWLVIIKAFPGTDSTSEDFIFSAVLAIIYIMIWFGIYTEVFSPFTNLKKLLELSQ